MGELSDEAKAELRDAIRIVNSDRTSRLNREEIRNVFKEEMAAWKPPAPEPNPTPPTPTPTPPPGPTPPPPAPPTPTPTPEPPKKRRGGYWPEYDD